LTIFGKKFDVEDMLLGAALVTNLFPIFDSNSISGLAAFHM
jgi:hypothetical protein